MAVNDYIRQLASLKQEYDNSPVYVVRDDLMPRQNAAGAAPRYGEEVPRQGWQAALDSLVRAVQMHQMNNPLYIPFKPGTPTLEQQKFDWLRQAQEAELTGMYRGQPTWTRQYQAGQLDLERQRLQQQKAQQKDTQGKTKEERQAAALADAYAAVDAALQKGLPPEDIERNIRSQSAELMRNNVNPDDVVDYLYSRVGLEEKYRQGQERQKLQQRPWWQKLVDAILPGAQYR